VMLEFSERVVEVMGAELTVLEAGSGPPVLVLHEELGHPGALRWHAEMARSHRLIVPIQPGFRAERVRWMRTVRDLAVFYACFLRQEGLSGCDVIGFSFGGWVAAEMAVGDPKLFTSMTLVAPFGIKSKGDFIMDMFPITSADYLRASVANPETTEEFGALYGEASPKQIEDWEDARAECARLGWEPYMHNPSLVALLRGITGLPTLVVWGDRDVVVPRDVAQAFHDNVSGSQLAVIEGVGHRPEIEATNLFLRHIGQLAG
jgi:pimeloyl-ACP methyl ester carboxylesterase